MTSLVILLVCIYFTDTSAAELVTGPDTFAIHSIGHASLMFEYKNMIIHVDPYSAQANYDLYPDADLLLVTHAHSDHYDINAISKIKTDSTILICTREVMNKNNYTGTIHVLDNGDSTLVKSIPVLAVPAYNIINGINHPKGIGNGYIVTLGEKRIYIAGDTENIPEMDSLGKIDIAFIPMNLPYTMSPEMAADAAKKIKPDILYIYHFSNSDTAKLRSLLSDQDMEIRIGKSIYYESSIRESKIPTFSQNIQLKEIRIYPNPVRDLLTVQITGTSAIASVYNIQGQLILKNELSGEGEHTMDLNSLLSGAYILKISHKKSQTEKLLLIKE